MLEGVEFTSVKHADLASHSEVNLLGPMSTTATTNPFLNRSSPEKIR
jgi:hypothetical protein